MRLEPADLPDDFAHGARAMFVDDVDVDAAIVAARGGRAAGIPVASDIEKTGGGIDDLMAAVTIPIFAAHIPAQLTGEPDPERALRLLRQRHDGPLVVTLGERGAAMLWEHEFLRQPGFVVDAVDTTGAGDLFRAAFLYGVLARFAPADLLRFACAAAAVSCTRRGAIASAPSRADVEALLRGA
jgi:sugar/nucleoside kinase (ribokinase family)